MLNRSETVAASDVNGSATQLTKRGRPLSPVKQAKERVRQKALTDYREGESLSAISVRYGISTSTISVWAKNAGLDRRPQGCRPSLWPDEQDWDIVQDVKAVVNGSPTLDEIGVKWGMTRAGIHRIYQRWKDWEPKPPFAKGDKIRLIGIDYEVLKPELFGGKVRELKTGTRTWLEWKHKVKVKKVKGSKRKQAEQMTYVAVKI